MKISREMEVSGLVVTHFGGPQYYDEASGALRELLEMHEGRDEVYEIVIHREDIEVRLDNDEIVKLRDEVRTAFTGFAHGALAFVCSKDLLFGLCRQLEMTMDNEKIAIAVFRSERLARAWIEEIRSLHTDSA